MIYTCILVIYIYTCTTNNNQHHPRVEFRVKTFISPLRFPQPTQKMTVHKMGTPVDSVQFSKSD